MSEQDLLSQIATKASEMNLKVVANHIWLAQCTNNNHIKGENAYSLLMELTTAFQSAGNFYASEQFFIACQIIVLVKYQIDGEYEKVGKHLDGITKWNNDFANAIKDILS